MSDLIKQIQGEVLPTIDQLSNRLARDFLEGLGNLMEGASQEAITRVEFILKQGASFKAKALTADDPNLALEYTAAVETSIRRVETILIAERILASEKFAATVANLWGKALEGLATIAEGVLGTVAAGIASGAISGLIGGEGGTDVSSIFPFS